MGKSSLGIHTDEIIVIGQPESEGENLRIRDHDTQSQLNDVLFTQDCTIFISSLKIQTSLCQEFHSFTTC